MSVGRWWLEGYLHIFGLRFNSLDPNPGAFCKCSGAWGRRQSRRRRLPPLSHGEASRAHKCRIHTHRVWQRQDPEIERQRGVGRRSRHRLAGGRSSQANCARRQLGPSTPRRGLEELNPTTSAERDFCCSGSVVAWSASIDLMAPRCRLSTSNVNLHLQASGELGRAASRLAQHWAYQPPLRVLL
ncbi:hypothetical protein SETIT_9G372600v2 [Setaria italica]|uniref:Uncharacterized protein n=1 Tax=Setaria italica TaxID=4555 RepID=A0A368SRP6_SETIT|nr:hypothetical protein SETIT_9G372600v2 [Setaria italica]